MYTFVDACFQIHGKSEHVRVEILRQIQASILKNTATTCELTSLCEQNYAVLCCAMCTELKKYYTY